MSAGIGESLKQAVVNSLTEMAQATPGLKENCTCPPEIGARELVALEFGASIAYQGSKFHGSLAVTCSRSILQASHPSIPLGFKVDDEGLADWCGEIANQIIGRIKNRLSDQNVNFNMSTPVRLPAEGKTVEGPKNCNVVHLNFSHGSTAVMKVSFWIDSSLDDSLEGLADAADAGSVMLFSASEGEAILF